MGFALCAINAHVMCVAKRYWAKTLWELFWTLPNNFSLAQPFLQQQMCPCCIVSPLALHEEAFLFPCPSFLMCCGLAQTSHMEKTTCWSFEQSGEWSPFVILSNLYAWGCKSRERRTKRVKEMTKGKNWLNKSLSCASSLEKVQPTSPQYCLLFGCALQ